MLTETQLNRVWEKLISAEVRSLYFGDLASRYTRQKQVIIGATFFLSSGAAATIAAKTSFVAPLVMSCIASALTAYSIAVGLDRKASAMAKLHSAWNRLAADYEHLWNHWYGDDAEALFDQATRRGIEISETGSIEAPHDEKLIEKWQDRVLELRGLVSASA